ncbi:MAG: hypothetical protein K2X82_02070 [Gemmataceae bacterium]|nr:hypothetical protein [Gemmataceae bacterium]
MATDLTLSPPPRTLDLTGLPEPVIEQVTRIVREAREKQTGEVTPSAEGARPPLRGRLAHLGLKTPTLEEFEEARREMWASFPRDLPDQAK